MQHVAIMKKSWGFIEQILAGQKTIESRWYSVKARPWNCIKPGEFIYFKNSGEAVSVRAEAVKVLQLAELTPKRAKEILTKYGNQIGLTHAQLLEFFTRIKHKKYCILIFLKNPRKIEPFEINKAGFGAMAAWITVDNIFDIRIY